MGLPFLEAVRCGPLSVAWLPPEAAVSEAAILALLSPEETAYAASLRHPARRDEYRRSRYLIRALTGFGGALPRRPEGDPSWPPGLKGSLTHKDGFVGVALAPDAAYAGVGIDAEAAARVKPAFEPRLASAAEGVLLDAAAAALGVPRAQLLALLFSFKEALFKCHFPLGRRMFHFHDAEVTGISEGKIRARVLLTTSPLTKAGHETEGFYTWKDTSKGLMALCAAILPS